MIWIIGGTSEARALAERLKDKVDNIVSVATCSGAEVLQGLEPVTGRMDYTSMADFIREKAIDMVIDMSHPYALEVTGNAQAACAACSVEYIRFVRKKTELDKCMVFDSIKECTAFLKEVKGCVFLTTGMKSIREFEAVKGGNRFVYRVIPSVFSIQECTACGVGMKDIVAMLGPFSEEMNYRLFKEFGADYVVMKDSGREGGTLEKLNACRRLGITPMVISRQSSETGMEDMEELIKLIFERRKTK